MGDTPEVAGLAAVDRFLETWNSRDKEAWADSLHYPHVRPSPRGPSRISPSAAAYAAAFSYERVLASGWDHSEWDYRRVLHTSKDKVHLAGESIDWARRVRAKGRPELKFCIASAIVSDSSRV